MPYIAKGNRKIVDPHIKEIINLITKDERYEVSPGDLNYIISSIIWKLFDLKQSYTKGNELMGVLDCVKQEFYRRKLVPYEDQKIIENGDLDYDKPSITKTGDNLSSTFQTYDHEGNLISTSEDYPFKK